MSHVMAFSIATEIKNVHKTNKNNNNTITALLVVDHGSDYVFVLNTHFDYDMQLYKWISSCDIPHPLNSGSELGLDLRLGLGLRSGLRLDLSIRLGLELYLELGYTVA